MWYWYQPDTEWYWYQPDTWVSVSGWYQYHINSILMIPNLHVHKISSLSSQPERFEKRLQ